MGPHETRCLYPGGHLNAVPTRFHGGGRDEQG